MARHNPVSLLGTFIALLVMSMVDGRSIQGSEIIPPAPDPSAPIAIQAERTSHWTEGQYDVWLLHGDVRLEQGELTARSRDAVLWIDQSEPGANTPSKIIAYLENDATLTTRAKGAAADRDDKATHLKLGKSWLGRFQTVSRIEVQGNQSLDELGRSPPLYGRGVQALGWHSSSEVQGAQFVEPLPAPLPAVAAVPSARNLHISSRSGRGSQIQSYPGATQDETIVVGSGGIRAVVSGITGVQGPEGLPLLESGVVTLEADRVVVWTTGLTGMQMGSDGTSVQGRTEVYLEGNIVFKEGDRVVYADRMYYDVNANRGTILNAEMLTPVPQYEGLMRLKAEIIQQIDQQNFVATGAAVTSSRLGVPRYWFQSENITFQDVQQPRFDPFAPPEAGEQVDHSLLVTSRNNFVYVGGIPVLYWPVFRTDATKPTFYVDRIRAKSDDVFGSQIFVDWDTYQVFGLDPIDGTKWTFSTDYLSDRGPAGGTNFTYDRDSLGYIPGPVRGNFDAWVIQDEGRDNLGFDRRALLPEEELRGRVLWQHRHYLPNDFQFTAELGLISDRNFLEQYFEREWDQDKDQITGIELKHYDAHSSWSVTADTQLNDFFTQTERLPRFDHFLIGQSIFDRLTWHGHSHAGYEHLRVAEPPSPVNPSEVAKFDPLAWEADREGLRVATRQEVDWPFQLGAIKVVPYLLGEAAHWGEDISGNELTRYYGQAGVRSSLPFWRVDPMVQSSLFNLNGLAHKVSLDGELFYSDAEEDLDQLALYDPLDDDATEHFRRRFYFDTFGGPAGAGGPDVPLKYDERYYALRTGMQSWVTAPSTEIADDLTLGKLAVRQRWQTKRGAPGQERIIDWIVLDVEGFFYPEADENNFGQEWGLFDYDFRWHVGDRFTLLSDGFADFFGQGLRTFSAGGLITRPERGSIYGGFRSIEGPISSNILMGSISYRMSEKWIFTGGASFDLGQTGNIGQTMQLTRIGESALMRLGFNYDVSRDNFGINFAIEPRFLASSQLGRVGGVQIPPAGARGLE